MSYSAIRCYHFVPGMCQVWDFEFNYTCIYFSGLSTPQEQTVYDQIIIHVNIVRNYVLFHAALSSQRTKPSRARMDYYNQDHRK